MSPTAKRPARRRPNARSRLIAAAVVASLLAAFAVTAPASALPSCRVGDVLTWISIVTDPVYLTEPYIKSRNFQLDPGYQVTLYPCSIDVEVPRPEGEIPHYLPGANPYLHEFTTKHRLPPEAARGGAESMYPEYARQLKAGTR